MDPHVKQSVSPWSLLKSFWKHRQLIQQMAFRDVIGRYKGSVAGLLWAFVHPLVMLIVYTFVFSVVFQTRWGDQAVTKKQDFAVLLFAGLIVHTFLSEVLVRAPTLILENVSYVKRVVFPLEVLPVTALCTALFHSVVSLGVLIVAFAMVNGFVHWTALLAPIVFVPLILFALGMGWLFSSIGVYLRDTAQTMNIATSLLLFLSPVFFPLSAVPEPYRVLVLMNPLTFIIEETRSVLIWGRVPNWEGLAIYSAIASILAWVSFVWFQKTRKGFADVL